MPELTSRDVEILQALTEHVRAFSLPQIARTWWAASKNSVENTGDRLKLLATDKLVELHRAPAHPEIELINPVIDWRPGDPDPDFGPSSYKLQARWNQHPVMTVCVSATRIAMNRFGGHGGRPPREIERTHDIHMAAVYLLYRSRSPEIMSGWIFEERLKQERRREKFERLPDVILRPEGGPERVIEFGGAYSKAKLTLFHAYCNEKSLPYEVW